VSLAYYPFYADRYEADTAHLTMLEDGAYNRLLRLCWRSPGCKLPHDLPWIFRQLRAHSAEDQTAVEVVLAEFFTKGRGKIWSKKLLQVYVQVSVAHQNKSEAGKKGAAAKALKSNKSEASTAKAELKQPNLNLNTEHKKEEPIGSSKKPPPRKRPETDLPEGWVPSDRNISDAEAKDFTAQEINDEADRFRDYHAAKGTRFRDWDAAWRTWLGNARKFAARGGMAGPSGPGGRGRGGSIASIVARRHAQG